MPPRWSRCSDHPARAVRARKDASIRVIFDLVKAGEACAALSAGNSGAMLAAALLVLGRLPEVERPAIVTYMPTLGGPVGLLDAGANVDVKPLQLVQFALMGEVWTRRVQGMARPRVGVLSNGEEPSKGTELTRRAVSALGRDRQLDFRGYAEGKDLFTGDFDVIVTDGFTGNVVLKTAEGTATAFVEWLRRSVSASTRARAGALLLKPALAELKQTLDWSEYGGAPLLGCDGTVLLAHGRSGARAIRNAIRAAAAAAGVDAREELSRACATGRRLLDESA